MGEDKASTAVPSSQTIMIDGRIRTDLSVFNIGGNNFFKLRDLGEALGFSVDYDARTNTAVVISAAPEPVPEPEPQPEPEPGPAATTYLSFPASVIMTENGGTDLNLSYDGEPQGLTFTTDNDCIELQLMPDGTSVYLWAKHPGEATVTAADSLGNTAACRVTVLKTYGLVEAVEAGLLSVDIKCDGMENADLTITNISSVSVSFRIEAGTYFASANARYQDMLVLSSLNMTLSPGMTEGPRRTRVRCMNLHRDMPAAGVGYSLSRTTDEKLRALAEKLCRSSRNNDIEQAAVWILTDNASYEDCGVLIYEDGSRAISQSDYEEAKELIAALP
ncbi:MAG: hypothetical protein IKN89_03610 [Oscillospiraceae bacterium]|nr:hypothetical protein [Oscillospiraceae bacterium]